MTVAELMKALSAFPPDLLVLVNGYEADYDAAQAPKLVDVAGPDPEAPPYFGDYIKQPATGWTGEPLSTLQGVLISRDAPAAEE